ncbi:MAG TPA: sigma-70 family RNA polymerase sigma factor [Blastocatellia bacterium]|nr:sigma-70 family RNA polymerase sigma factor [Blastocatellia bacterium]
MKGAMNESAKQAPGELTQLLTAWSRGDAGALERLTPLVYAELHQLAHRYLNRERAGHTLQTTALVHEAFLRLIGKPQKNWHNRSHFYAIAAQMMRRILVDYARANLRAKRGGEKTRLDLEDLEIPIAEPALDPDLVALDAALEQFAQIDRRRSLVVELRFFGGLSVEETARVLEVAPDTVVRDWRIAKAWLFRYLNHAI